MIGVLMKSTGGRAASGARRVVDLALVHEASRRTARAEARGSEVVRRIRRGAPASSSALLRDVSAFSAFLFGGSVLDRVLTHAARMEVGEEEKTPHPALSPGGRGEDCIGLARPTSSRCGFC